MRKNLSVPGLLEQVRARFDQIHDPRDPKKRDYPLSDILMSALAMFSLKDPSLLSFDNLRKTPERQKNLKNLYNINKAPCDSAIRKTLDQVPPESLRPIFRDIHQQLQKNRVLESYKFLGKILCSIDGTGLFSSSKIQCDQCCVKNHRNGDKEYYHQLLAASVVHPDYPTVFPLCPEIITRQDGETKNDCECNSSKRLLPALRKDFPHLKMILLHDALSCNGPHIKMLQELDFNYIITAKPRAGSVLLNQVMAGLIDGQTQERLLDTDEKGVSRGYRYISQISLNKTHQDLKVNYIDYWETDKTGKTFHYACVTDLDLTAQTVEDIVRAGRSRWKIENETFNTLKNQGYHLEHNYGHGQKYLSSVFSLLMMLAFLIDQVQEHSCAYFKAARHCFHSRRLLWEQIRGLFYWHVVSDWEEVFACIIWGREVLRAPLWNDSG